MRRALALALLAAFACDPPSPPAGAAPARDRDDAPVTISVIGTNDVHGHAERLPWLGGYLANLRAARAEDGGGVVLVSAGDMWQGTLASNESEGAVMVRGFAALGYDAAAIGNHELDYGPVGPRAAAGPGDDPRGALLARAAEAAAAGVPFLGGNFLVEGRPARWPNVAPSVLVERAGRRIGIVGVSTEETPRTTVRANVRDLSMAPLAETIVREARALRERGAQAVIVAAHAGGRCERFDAPEELGSCEADSEIFEVARALPRGLVDVIVAGHTHQAVAHEVAGVAIIESRAYGRSFGRVDLEVGPEGVVGRRIHAPRDLCERRPRNPDDCEVGRYEGRPVVRDARVAAAIAPELEAASARLEERLGPRLRGRFERSYRDESPLGNLLADLTLEAVPGADLALVNGGGIRADLPSGPLRFGSVYEAFPFDNRVALLRMRAEAVASLFEDHARRGGGGLSIAGLDVEVRCGPRGPEATLRDRRGQRVEAARVLTLVTSDYVATSGLFEGRRPEITYEDRLLRDAVVEGLRRREGLDPRDFRRPRYRLPGRRPVCR